MQPAVWEKALWISQPFPDNYIPKEEFLSSLRTNANFVPYTYSDLLLASTGLTQHLSATFVFVTIFIRLKNEELDPRVLLWGSIALFVGGYAVWELLLSRTATAEQKFERRVKTLKSSILIFLSLMSLAPVLRTLTAATSSDSIWALSAFLFLLNILLADYTPMDITDMEDIYRLSSVLSINAAVSSSVVLASRLSTDIGVFSLIFFSVQLFAMFPMLRRRLQASPPFFPLLFTAILFVTLIVLNLSLSTFTTLLYTATLTFVTFGAPAVVVWAQRYKNEIRGQWDVAIPKVD
ncbi:phosphatidylinositol N-acetylglucosaminyltransferase [Flagelloscypha sp. PMI_526]|nr:phosphatidylinositol N-acetylglucosaminyltransferase [Flagelloscypha sp. PMI_526]